MATILVINAGSSSVKFGLYSIPTKNIADLAAKEVKATLIASEHFSEHGVDHDFHPETIFHKFHEVHSDLSLFAICHRFVHGGTKFHSAVIANEETEKELQSLIPLDPLHTIPSLLWLDLAKKEYPEAIQIAAFDTNFYVDMPLLGQLYAVPLEWKEKYGVQRYGFHGFAHASMLRYAEKAAKAAGATAPNRVLSLQLGSGCSITAIKGGRPLANSMGFSALEGLVMSTRCGDLDASLVIYLADKMKIKNEDVQARLFGDCGIKGICGKKDFKEVEECAPTDEKCQLAIDLFVYRVIEYIGKYWAIMGGVDTITIGGGIGENSASCRKRIIDKLDFIGVKLDEQKNKTRESGLISAADSSVKVYMVNVDEEEVIIEQGLEEMKKQHKA